MGHTLFLISLCLLLVGGRDATAQGRDDLGKQIEAWATGQQQLWRGIESIRFRDRSTREMDGPFGTTKIESEFETVAWLNDREWDRKAVRFNINGREARPMQRQRAERAWMQTSQLRPQDTIRPGPVFPRMIRGMEPSSAEEVTIDGRPAWRIELVRTNGWDRVERATLWFDKENRHLRRTRLVLNVEQGTVRVDTEYGTFEGLDLPVSRTIEGTVQVRRRMRTFSTLVAAEWEFGDYRVTRR